MRHRIEIEFDAPDADAAMHVFLMLQDRLQDLQTHDWVSHVVHAMTPALNDALPRQNATFPAWLPRVPPTTGTATPA